MAHYYGIHTQPHVWHQGRKVTGKTEAPGPRGHYKWINGRGYVWVSSRQETREQRMQRYRRNGRFTVADRARPATNVRSATGYFRLLDAHGSPYGRRLLRLGPERQMFRRGHLSWLECLVQDQHGNRHWIEGRLRVREVDQQPEDLHSQACRIIKRMHREACRED